ncbi:hypothetical protein [Halobacteriovorax sp. HLS]|uniref:hypothetical protein n=1 Tax=Halobacteriovorax sp. HLS TaxID=2234000 RepID=UPI000FDB3D51|nr:hypothetical protein [Halobacteriovorax sp. HLS]
MKKLIIVIALTLVSQLAFGYTVESSWNDSYQKELSFYCVEGDNLCQDLCENNSVCTIREETCHNCIGTSISITYIFNYMGKAYTNTEVEKNEYDVLSTLQSGNFVTFSSKSIYNHVDRFNSSALKRNFRSLCSDGTRYPIVLFNKNTRNQRVGDVQFVFCDNGVFEMSFGADVITNFESANSLF